MSGRNAQCAIIGRLNREHDAYSLDADQIKYFIALELIAFVTESDISFVPPNFVIHLDNPFAQEAILTQRTLRAHHFQLDILPWSKEYEWAQLPWITVPKTPGSTIIINPLDILPIVPKTTIRQGSNWLMDTFASKIPKNYDLRAPDFSYLLITELKYFYKTKFNIFMDLKQAVQTVHAMLNDFFLAAEKQLANVMKLPQPTYGQPVSAELYDTHLFLDRLAATVRHTDLPLSSIDRLATSILEHADTPLNLQGFTEGPPQKQIPVPSNYADRLKRIYIAAIQKIHCTTPIIETIERETNRYDTYVTVANFTRRYSGEHTTNAAAMEAAAIFYALKQLTNVQGYRIVDLNYPILETLVSDIDSWNARVNNSQMFMTVVCRQIDNIYKNVVDICQPAELSRLHIQNPKCFNQAIEALVQTLEQYYMSMNNLYQNVSTLKEVYHNAKIEIYSPTRSYYHWGRATRPSIASASRV